VSSQWLLCTITSPHEQTYCSDTGELLYRSINPTTSPHVQRFRFNSNLPAKFITVTLTTANLTSHARHSKFIVVDNMCEIATFHDYCAACRKLKYSDRKKAYPCGKESCKTTQDVVEETHHLVCTACHSLLHGDLGPNVSTGKDQTASKKL
jgi:hypothetical protein